MTYEREASQEVGPKSQLSRRVFLGALGVGAAGLLVPEWLLEPRKVMVQVPKQYVGGIKCVGESVAVTHTTYALGFKTTLGSLLDDRYSDRLFEHFTELPTL